MSGLYDNALSDKQSDAAADLGAEQLNLADDKVYKSYVTPNGSVSVRTTIPRELCKDIGLHEGDLIKHKQIGDDRWIVEVADS